MSQPTNGPQDSGPPRLDPYGGRPSFESVPFNPVDPAPRDPNVPFGEAPPPSNSIDNYRPPAASRGRTALLVLAGIALLGIIAAIIWPRLDQLPPVTPSTPPGTVVSTPGSSHSTEPTSVASINAGADFVGEDEDSAGHWEILSSRWTDEGLLLDLRIQCTRGPMTYSFFAFNNETTESADASDENHPDALTYGDIAEGDTLTGQVFLPIERGDATIILATSTGAQVSALAVAG